MLAACNGPSGSDPPPPDEDEVEVIIPETTKVIDQATRDSLLEFTEAGTLRFAGMTPQLQALTVGDVVVSEPAAAAPFGFLRRVTVIRPEGGELVVETEHATLEEAISQGSLSVQMPLTPDHVESVVTHLEGVSFDIVPSKITPQDSHRAFRTRFDRVMVDVGGDQVTLNGSYTFIPDFEFDLSIRCCVRVRRLKIAFGYSHEADITLKGAASLTFEEEVSIHEWTFKTITFKIGPVPVTLTPKVEIVLGVDGNLRANTTYTVTQKASLQAGAEYRRNEGWENISGANFDADFDVQELDGDGTSNTAYVGAKGKILLYGILGPTATIKALVEADVAIPRDPVWILYTGIKAEVGFEVTLKVIGTLVDYNATVLELKKEVARSSNLPPILEIVQPTDGDDLTLNRRVSLTATAMDPEDGTLSGSSITWRSDVDGALGAGTSINAIFTDPGQRTITATATDSHGLSTSETVTVDVVNTPPSPFVSGPGESVPATAQVLFFGGATDPNDPNEFGEPVGTGIVACDRISWSVNPPDVLSASSGCQIMATFNEPGLRTVTLTATDMHGASTSLDTLVSVGPPPPNPAPVIEAIAVTTNFGEELTLNDAICVNCGETPLTLSVSASDPEDEPLTFSWRASSDGSAFIEVGSAATTVWDPSDTFAVPQGVFRPLTIRVVVSDGTTAMHSPVLEFTWGNMIF